MVLAPSSASDLNYLKKRRTNHRGLVYELSSAMSEEVKICCMMRGSSATSMHTCAWPTGRRRSI
ncbi:unnamed protein product, partial [Plutella xylostella]